MAATMTLFSDWLGQELSRRGSNRAKLAAGIDSKPQTISAWFNEGRIPSPEFCRRVARYLHVPEESVLRIAGHLSADDAPEEPSLPAWLESLLTELDDFELHVVEDTARGLLRLREERARYEANPPTPPRGEP